MQAVVMNLQQEAMTVRQHITRQKTKGRFVPLKQQTIRDFGHHNKQV